jgi:hypothetical protein
MRRACLLGLFVVCAVDAGPKLYLKTRVIDTGDAEVRAGKRGRSALRYFGRKHLIIQMNHIPGDSDRKALAERGATVLGYVHENGLVISISDPERLRDAGLTWMGAFDADDKISPLLTAGAVAGEPRLVLLEVFPDSDMARVRQEVLDAGAVLVDNPDLTDLHLLVRATAEQVTKLAENDDLAYFFPAWDELISGRPLTACVNALTAQGATGQYIPKIGDGWDGPGQNAVSLGYSFSKLTDQLPGDSARAEILRAFNEWAKYIKLTLAPASTADSAKTVNILFATGDHGDSYPFDGRGGVLAHTFYPAPPNPESLAGDMHFDNAETWKIGADKDLFSVALHEFGHALGLGHSDRPGAVMYPYYSQVTGLTADDIAAAQSLYAVQDSTVSPGTPSDPTTPSQPTNPTTPTPPSTPSPTTPLSFAVNAVPSSTTADAVLVTGTVNGGAGGIVVGWSSDRGSSGLAQGGTYWSAQVPLLNGANTITFTASDAAVATVSRAVVVTRQVIAGPVIIELNYPAGTGAFTTTQSPVSLQGSASQSSGIRSVTWSTDKGASGMAAGTNPWNTGAIPLQAGLNTVSLLVVANDSTTAFRTVLITYAQSTSRDTTAPSLTILFPASVISATTSDSIVVRGSASDNTGVTSVVWFTAAGASGSATGTTSWSTSPIPLIRGDNSIVIRGFDAAGNMAWRSLSVTRQ